MKEKSNIQNGSIANALSGVPRGRGEALVLIGGFALQTAVLGLGFERMVRKDQDIAYVKKKIEQVQGLLAEEVCRNDSIKVEY